jgi:hypothetical protein
MKLFFGSAITLFLAAAAATTVSGVEQETTGGRFLRSSSGTVGTGNGAATAGTADTNRNLQAAELDPDLFPVNPPDTDVLADTASEIASDPETPIVVEAACVPFGSQPFVETTFTAINYPANNEIDFGNNDIAKALEDGFRLSYNANAQCSQSNAFRRAGLTFLLASASCQFVNETELAITGESPPGPQFLIGTQLRTNAATFAGIPYAAPIMFDPRGPLLGNITRRPNQGDIVDECDCAGPPSTNVSSEFTDIFQELLTERSLNTTETDKIRFARMLQMNIIEGCRPPNNIDICFNDEGVCLSANATELFVDDTDSPTVSPTKKPPTPAPQKDDDDDDDDDGMFFYI